ncbi:MAG: putative lipoprotein [Frankiales bacterium]|nr:putative lipoprotein [Frankiales bacterium]
MVLSSRRHSRPLLVLVGASLLAAVLLPLRPASAAPVPALVDVTVCPADGRLVGPRFLGLSVEWSTVTPWFGSVATEASTATVTTSAPVQVVPATVRLLQGLRDTTGRGGLLRVGGNSQDGYVWDAHGRTVGNRLFRGTVTPGMLQAVLEAARQAGWQVQLGTNLAVDRPDLVHQEVAYAVRHDPGHVLAAVELGNEPNAYLSEADYLARFTRYADALAADPVTRHVRLAGPGTSQGVSPVWQAHLQALVRQRYGVSLVWSGWHAYGNKPTVGQLLAPATSDAWRRAVLAARAAVPVIPSRITEGNSVGTGGLSTVSNVTGSGTWLADTLLTGAHAGLAGYSAHAWDGAIDPEAGWRSWYTPFTVRRGQVQASPELYAMSLLAGLSGSRFCTTTTRGFDGARTTDAHGGIIAPVAPAPAPVDPSTTTVVTTPVSATSTPRLRTWSTVRPGRKAVDVYLLSEPVAGGAGTGPTQTVLVRVKPAVTVATVAAPPPATALAYGGRSCGDLAPSVNGAHVFPEGVLRPVPLAVAPSAPGSYRVGIRPCQVVRLTVPLVPTTPAATPAR